MTSILAMLGFALLAPKAASPKPTAVVVPEGPAFVVEGGHLVWPEKCEGGAVPDGVLSRVRATVDSAGLLFVGRGQRTAAVLGAPVCLKGECGNGQVGLPLGSGTQDVAGVLLSRALVKKSRVDPLKLRGVEGADPFGEGQLVAGRPAWLPECGDAPVLEEKLPEGKAPLTDCRGWLSDESAVQVQGAGEMQESGYPLYKKVRFRMLERKGQDWKPGDWYALARGEGTRLPVPAAVLVEGKTARVVWLSQQGICCPSISSAWVTEVGAAGVVREGTKTEAGFGQPCD